MDMLKIVPSTEDINRIDLIKYLALMGIDPVSSERGIYRYFSPFKKELFPTFVVSKPTNTWSYGSEMAGKSVIDFAVLFHSGTIGDLNRHFSEHPLFREANPRLFGLIEPDKRIDLPILDQGKLLSHQLACFLKERRIPWELAKIECSQVEFGRDGRVQKAIAFANDLGGFAVENSNFKGLTGPRGSTYLDHKGSSCAVFDDFFDFLSFRAIAENALKTPSNYLVLNGQDLTESTLSILNQQKIVKLFLPLSETGQRITNRLKNSSRKYFDESSLYRNYGSLNGWMRFIGQKNDLKAEQAQKLRRSG